MNASTTSCKVRNGQRTTKDGSPRRFAQAVTDFSSARGKRSYGRANGQSGRRRKEYTENNPSIGAKNKPGFPKVEI